MGSAHRRSQRSVGGAHPTWVDFHAPVALTVPPYPLRSKKGRSPNVQSHAQDIFRAGCGMKPHAFGPDRQPSESQRLFSSRRTRGGRITLNGQDIVRQFGGASIRGKQRLGYMGNPIHATPLNSPGLPVIGDCHSSMRNHKPGMSPSSRTCQETCQDDVPGQMTCQALQGSVTYLPVRHGHLRHWSPGRSPKGSPPSGKGPSKKSPAG